MIEDMMDKIVEKMQTKADFEHFLLLLMEDFKRNRNLWENRDLESYLSGLYGFVLDISGYYKNMGENINTGKPSWRQLADLLLAARVYE
jgi:hypothetical protein